MCQSSNRILNKLRTRKEETFGRVSTFENFGRGSSYQKQIDFLLYYFNRYIIYRPDLSKSSAGYFVIKASAEDSKTGL